MGSQEGAEIALEGSRLAKTAPEIAEEGLGTLRANSSLCHRNVVEIVYPRPCGGHRNGELDSSSPFFWAHSGHYNDDSPLWRPFGGTRQMNLVPVGLLVALLERTRTAN